MANAICTQCGAQWAWHAGRGQRLADRRCPTCGGTLTAKREKTHSAAGKTYTKCAICGRRIRRDRILHEVRAQRAYAPGVQWVDGNRYNYVDDVPIHPASDECCWLHRPIPLPLARFTSNTDRDNDLFHRLRRLHGYFSFTARHSPASGKIEPQARNPKP